MSIVRRIPAWRRVARHVIQRVEGYAHFSEVVSCLYEFPDETLQNKTLQLDAEHLCFGNLSALVVANIATGLQQELTFVYATLCAVTPRGDAILLRALPYRVELFSKTQGTLWTTDLDPFGRPYDATVTAAGEVWILFADLFAEPKALHAFALCDGTWLRQVLPDHSALTYAVSLDITPSGLICLVLQDADEYDSQELEGHCVVVLHPDGRVFMACRTESPFLTFGVARDGDTLLMAHRQSIRAIRLADGKVVNTHRSCHYQIVDVTGGGIYVHAENSHHLKIVHTPTGAVVMKFRYPKCLRLKQRAK